MVARRQPPIINHTMIHSIVPSPGVRPSSGPPLALLKTRSWRESSSFLERDHLCCWESGCLVLASKQSITLGTYHPAPLSHACFASSATDPRTHVHLLSNIRLLYPRPFIPSASRYRRSLAVNLISPRYSFVDAFRVDATTTVRRYRDGRFLTSSSESVCSSELEWHFEKPHSLLFSCMVD